ncbi:MAG: response regulator [Candidatus Omnitrophica bacterium]|nr:response regulator [Candidatus Omnitrophota bacterium]
MRTLLIVDDEIGITDEVKSFFEEEGYQVFTADTAKEGIQIVSQVRPDVLLLDMKLPDMSGLNVLQIAKAISPATKVIVNTGYVDQAIIDEAAKMGRDVFLQKPFDLMVLWEEVDKLFRQTPGPPQS